MQLRTRKTNVNHHLSLSDTDRLRLLVDICLGHFHWKMHRNAVGRCCWRKKLRWIDLAARKATKTSSTVFEYCGVGLVFAANAAG